MSTQLTNTQQELYDLLSRDQNSNHQLLTHYLKLILRNQPLELKLQDGSLVKLAPEQAWQEIIAWANENEVSLPMGDRGSRKLRATRLLNYLELNVQGKSREAAANFQAILDSVKTNPLKNAVPTNREARTYKKLNELRNLQYQLLNDKILGKLTTDIQQTSYLQKFKNDPETFSMLSGLLAANAINLRKTSNQTTLDIAQEITQLIQPKAGYRDINNAMHLAYAKSAEKDLAELVEVIDSRVKRVYGDDDKQFTKDMSRVASLSSLTSIADVPAIIDALPRDPAEKNRIVSAIQSSIVSSSTRGYVSGEEIIKTALESIGIPEDQILANYNQLSVFAPLLEEARNNEASKILGGEIFENNPRLLHTLPLTSEVGVSPETPWITKADLNATKVTLEKKYNTKDLQGALQQQLTLGSQADFEAITEINNYFKSSSERDRYENILNNNSLLSIRDRIGRARGRYAAIKAPIDRFSQKVGKVYWAADDFIHSPVRFFSDQFAKIEEKLPFLSPDFYANKFSSLQIGIAQKILKWSDGLIGKKHWASGMLNHVSDFSRAFVHEEGSWSRANFVFVQTKWGNLLDWGAKQAGYKGGWGAVKAQIGTKLWSGFSKVAPGIAQKISAGSLGKLVASFTAGTLSAGTTIAIQIGLLLLGAAYNKVKQFFTDKQFQDKVFRRLPMLISAASVALAGLPALIVGGVIALGSSLIGSIGLLFTTLFTTIFLPAIIFIGAVIGSLYLLTQVLNVTIRLDSSPGQLITSILCDNDGGGGNPAINTAVCIVQILTDCGLNPLLKGNANTPAWQCALASLVAADAMEVLKESATKYDGVQCVGFVRAIDVATGGPGVGWGNANTLGSSPPSGYTFASGIGSCAPGDIFVDTGGAVGHTGLFISNDGPYIKCADANGAGLGVVRGPDSCVWDSGKIAGCLKKN